MTHPNLSCAAFARRLPDYLEGELDLPGLADAELHLAACATCRALVDEVRDLTRQASALPYLAPARDLWAGIETRIATPVVALPARSLRPRWQLGAIAAGLVAVTALSTWQFARRAAHSAPVVAATAPAVSAPAPAPSAPRTSMEPAVETRVAMPAAVTDRPTPSEPRATYADEIVQLHRILQARANDLDPATVAILESSIATIDSAIVEAKAALERDPASAFLESHLNKSLERKLGLLRKAALLSPST